MFRIHVGDDLEADFYCPFCDTTQEWPFGSQILWSGTDQQKVYPEGGHVVASHSFGDWNLKKFGFAACDQAGKWTPTSCETIDRESGKILESGRVDLVGAQPHITHTP